MTFTYEPISRGRIKRNIFALGILVGVLFNIALDWFFTW